MSTEPTTPARLAPRLGALVAAELRADAARLRISHAEIARQIHRPSMWLSRRLAPTSLQPMTLDDLQRIASALEVDPADVVVRAMATTTGSETR